MKRNWRSADAYDDIVGSKSFAREFLKRNQDHGTIYPTSEDDVSATVPDLPVSGTVQALLEFGGSLGDVRSTLDKAVAMFCDGQEVRLVTRSSDFRTAPGGITDQPPFVNRALAVDTTLKPRALLERALRIEALFGRQRAREQRWEPSVLDVDIIAYGDLELDEDGLTLPHPGLLECPFVLAPLAEIAPDRKIRGVTIKEALARLDAGSVEKLPPRQLLTDKVKGA